MARGYTEGEKELLSGMFGNLIDFDQVTLHDNPAGEYGFSPDGNLYLGDHCGN